MRFTAVGYVRVHVVLLDWERLLDAGRVVTAVVAVVAMFGSVLRMQHVRLGRVLRLQALNIAIRVDRWTKLGGLTVDEGDAGDLVGWFVVVRVLITPLD